MKIGIESYTGDFILENDKEYTKEELTKIYDEVISKRDERDFVPDELASQCNFVIKNYEGEEKLDFWIDTDVDIVYKPIY